MHELSEPLANFKSNDKNDLRAKGTQKQGSLSRSLILADIKRESPPPPTNGGEDKDRGRDGVNFPHRSVPPPALLPTLPPNSKNSLHSEN